MRPTAVAWDAIFQSNAKCTLGAALCLKAELLDRPTHSLTWNWAVLVLAGWHHPAPSPTFIVWKLHKCFAGFARQRFLSSGKHLVHQTRVSVLVHHFPTLHPWVSVSAFSECWWNSVTSVCSVLCWIHSMYCHLMVPLHFNCLRQIPTSYGLGGWETNFQQVTGVGGHLSQNWPHPTTTQFTNFTHVRWKFFHSDKSFSIGTSFPNPPPLSIGKRFFRVLVELCHICLFSFVLDPFDVLPPHGSFTLQLSAPDPNLLWLCRAPSLSTCTFCILLGHSLWTSSAQLWHCGGQSANHRP